MAPVCAVDPEGHLMALHFMVACSAMPSRSAVFVATTIRSVAVQTNSVLTQARSRPSPLSVPVAMQ